MRILVVDGHFPNKYTAWRNYELNSLIENFETDIFVYKGGVWAGIPYEFDYDFCNQNGRLDDYKILILDSKYNHLDKFNSGFDGTAWNNRHEGSYIFSRDGNFDPSQYDAIYHIFLGCYIRFNNDFRNISADQVIHLYAGGGFTFDGQMELPQYVNYISSHPVTSGILKSKNLRFIDCWTAPQAEKNEKLPFRHRKPKSKMVVSFSSMGYGSEKGDLKYILIATLYRFLHPFSFVRFISIGNCKPSPFVKRFKPMDYKSLEEFYEERVHVSINPMSTQATNGFPLGLEYFKKGCVVLTTDPNRVVEHYEEQLRPIVCTSIREFIYEVHKLWLDSEYWNQESKRAQAFFHRYSSYSEQQAKVISMILGNLSTGLG